MSGECTFIIYSDRTGKFMGFYNNIDVVNSMISNDPDLAINEISPNLVNELLTEDFAVDIDKVVSKNKQSAINEITRDYIKITPATSMEDEETFESYKQHLISELNDMKRKYVSYGTNINIDGKLVNFKFDGDHQYRMQEILNHYPSNAVVYYAPADGYETEIKCFDIKRAYIELFNMKTYLHTYVEVFSEWIHIHLTIDMYRSKEEIYTFGYINDYILEEVNNRYDQQKILQH